MLRCRTKRKNITLFWHILNTNGKALKLCKCKEVTNITLNRRTNYIHLLGRVAESSAEYNKKTWRRDSAKIIFFTGRTPVAETPSSHTSWYVNHANQDWFIWTFAARSSKPCAAGTSRRADSWANVLSSSSTSTYRNMACLLKPGRLISWRMGILFIWHG
jgi:hypothetical protein